MCGRYRLSARHLDGMERWLRTAFPEFAPRYNIAPSQEVPVVRTGEQGYELAMLRWGLVPYWAKDPRTGYRMINARAETLAAKPAFRSAFSRRRCLIPADGFYEWKQTDGGKQPYDIRMKDGGPFAFAGLWERWRSAAGESVESCSIIVTEANELVRPIHDRMPVILAPESYALWLDPEVTKAEPLQTLLRPYAAERMTASPVSVRVNSPKIDEAALLEPLASTQADPTHPGESERP
jgi:putative SOS response-associated peptidase YedK